MARSGYTLPVFATASAIAALHQLRYQQSLSVVSVNLIEPDQIVEIPVQVAPLSSNQALAMTRSDPGDNFDVTRDTPVWALVEWSGVETITIKGGEGIGIRNVDNTAAIYSYAHKLLLENLQGSLGSDEKITVTIILPAGRSLAKRTSNAAFGVVDGLSLLGTTGISQPLTAPEQLEAFQEELYLKASRFDSLVFCIGENGLDLASKHGINSERLVKTANWLGSMLVAAGALSVKEILLFGYHGKLMKLAAGIFHTHHHLADGRREILTTYCAISGLTLPDIKIIFDSPTAEAALQHLRELDRITGSDWVISVYDAIASAIDLRSVEYIKNHSEDSAKVPVVGSILFDRDRKIIVKSKTACSLMPNLC